jgi:sugar lactone lactonase YvrE
MEPNCIWPLQAKLGEGALWVDGAFWFTDIKLQKIHRLDPVSGEKKRSASSRPLPAAASSPACRAACSILSPRPAPSP